MCIIAERTFDFNFEVFLEEETKNIFRHSELSRIVDWCFIVCMCLLPVLRMKTCHDVNHSQDLRGIFEANRIGPITKHIC